MPQDKIKEVYDLISDLGYFSDENEFRTFVSDPKKRKEAYSLIADAGYFKDENEFNSYFEPEKKKPTSVGLPRAFQPFQEGVGQSVKMPSPSTSTSTFTKTPTTTTPKPSKLSEFNKKYGTNYTAKQIQGKEPVIVKPEDESFVSELYESAKRGSAMLGSMLASTPSFMYDIAAYPQNKLAELTGLPIGTSSEQIAQTLGLPENEIANYYKQIVKEGQAKVQQKYDKGVSEYLFGDKPDYTKGFKLLANQVVESAPISLSMMMGSVAGIGPLASTLGGGVVFGSENMNELEDSNLSEAAKVENALTKGLFEGIFEQFGITKLGGVVSNVFKEQGKDAALEIAKKGFIETYYPALKKYIGIGAEESIGEAATQYAQNMVSILSGEKPDLDPMDGVLDAAIVGLGSSAAFSTPTAVYETLALSKKRKEAREKQDKIQKIEEAIANPETTPEAKAVLSDMSKTLNEEVSDIYEEAKADYEALPDEKKQELVEVLSKKEELEIAANDPSIDETIKEDISTQIKELDTKVEAISKEARISALERLKVSEQEITPQEPKIQEDEKITAKEENVEPMLQGVQPNRDEVKGGEASTELYSDQKGETQEVTPPTKENLKGENVETQSKEGVEEVKSPVFDDKNLTNEEEVKPKETKEKVFTYNKEGDIVEAEVINRGKDTSSILIDGKQTIRANSEVFSTKEDAQKRIEREQVEPTENPALKDVESTAKALEGLINNTKDHKRLNDFIAERLSFDKNIDLIQDLPIGIEDKELQKKFKYIPIVKAYIDFVKKTGLSPKIESALRKSKAYHKAKEDGGNPELVQAVEQLLTNKPQEYAIKSGKIEQSNQSERKGVTEQKQGEQEDRVNQEEPITKGQASPSGSDSFSEGGKEQEVKREKGFQKVVLDEGNGIIINDLFNEWNSIKNEKDLSKWKDKVRETKFGTYGTVGLIETLNKFNVKLNDVTKRTFYNDIESALNIPINQRTYSPNKVQKQDLEIEKEVINEITPAEVESVKESPKAKVREKVVKIVENKSGKSLSQWKKESLALVDKVINAIIDNETSDPKVKQGFLDSLVDLPTNEAKDILEPLGVKVTDKLQIVIPTPQGEIKANISTLVGFRKQIASLSDSSVVSNENTRLPSRSRKVDAQVAATEFYEPESQEDADFELSSAKESLDNAKKNGNKKLIELAQVQYDFYKDWADNFDRNTEFKARMLAEAQKRKEYQERQKDIESKSKELNALINKDLAVFKEAGIYNQEDLYDFLEALGIKEIPTKMTKDLYANLFAKAAIDSNKHTYLTYAASIKDRKRDVPKITAKSSWKKISQARDIENQNKEVDKLLELANKYETEATKIFKELTEGKGEDRTIKFLDSLKIRAKGRAFGILPPFAIPIGVWNAAIDTIILGVKAGRVISEVVQEAIDYINANHGKFDEKAFKDMLVDGGVVTEDELVVEDEPTDEAEGEPKKDTERKPKQGSTPNSRVRSHYTTVTDNKTLSNITDELDSLEYEYEVKPEKSDKEKAIAYIEKYGVEESYQNVIDNTYNEELAGSEANALASLVYGALSKAMALAIKEGDMAAADLIKERSKELIKKISERGTDAGRFVNSFKYFALDFSNPETAAYNLQKEVEEINKKTREKSSNISNANSVAKDIAKEVKKGKAKVVSEVVKDIDEMLYGTITKGKKGLTPEQKAKVKSVFEAFKVNKDGKVQSSVVPIKEIIAAIVTPEKYNQFIDKVADAVAEGVSLSVAMTRVSAEFIKNNIATPKEMAAARKALTEQVNGIKTKKPLTEKQIERRKASDELKAATERFNLEKQLEKEKKKAEDLRQKDAEKVLKEVEKLELQRTRQNIKDLEKSIKDLQNQVKTDEELVNEIITEYLSLEGDAKTKNEKLVNLVKDNIEGLTDSEARVIATKIAKGVAEKIKKKLETKFGSALSKEEQEQKKISATPKTKEDILDQLVKASNLGVASPQLIMDFFQNKYGIQNLSAEDVNGIIELSKALANAPTKNRKGVILAEIQKVIDSKKKRTLAELLQNLWYARVLSPVLTGVLGTGDVNLAYNILAVKLNMIEAPLTASINSMKYAVKDAKDNIGDLKKVGESIKQNLLGLLTDSLSASLAPFVQRVNYDADANLFKTIIKNPTLLRESITYFTESLSNGLAFKKDTENPFTATGASTFNISNYLKYFEDARKGDKKAKAIIAMAVNKYVNSVTNMLGGQDLAFGTMVGRGYMSTLVREKLYKEGLRGKELNSKVLETILDTKIQGELAAEKALSYRMNFDISIELQMDNDGNTYYIIKDKGKVYKERQGIRLIEKRFDSKDEAIDYAREVVAPKSNTFRLDVINILNERLGEDVLKNMNRISSNDLLSAQAEGSARLVFSMATFIIDNLNKLSDAFNDMSKNLDTYDWKDILGMAKEKDIDAVKGIIRKVLKYITKTISILVRSTANLLAFMRVGLNSVRNQSSYIFPIGVLRYFASYFTDDKGKTRSLLSTMSYEMSDTEKSKILAKAMIGAYTFSATAYLSTFLTANADDDDEDKETLEERERARELFRSWYKEKTGEDLPRNIDDFYFKLTKGDVIGSLNWLTPEEYKFYKKTGLFPENSIFLGFDAKGKPIFESILNDPSYAMAVSASTYKLIQAFGDEEQKEMAKINAAITPFYSWKDMTIGQGGISVLLGNKKPQEKMETIVQVSVLDNLEVLSPRIIPVTLQYFYPEARRTDNLFEAIERQESVVKGSGQFFIQRVFPLTAGWYQSTQAPKMYGMLGETIVRVPAEKQGLFSAYYAKLLRESLSEDDSDLSKAISKKLNEWYNTNQTIDESKLYIWMAANGKRTSFKPPVEQAIVNGDGEIEKLTMSQKEKYEPKAAVKSKEFLLKNLYKLQILREVGGETTEDKEKAFSTEIQKIFKQNFLNEYYLGEKSFGDKTAEMVAASVNNMQTKLDDKVNSAIIEYIKRTEKNKDIKITPEEEEMASKGYTAEQYLAFIKDEEDKIGKLERARLVGILTQEQFMKSLEMLGKFKSKSGLDDYLKNNKPF